MIIEGNNKDLGVIPNNYETKFSAVIKNQSGKEERIVNLLPGCGSCTTARVDKVVLQPGETTSLHVTFKPISTGYNSKSINIDYVEGNSVVTITTTFRFTANVR